MFAVREAEEVSCKERLEAGVGRCIKCQWDREVVICNDKDRGLTMEVAEARQGREIMKTQRIY